MNLQEGLTTVLKTVVEEHSRRTVEFVVNHSRRFAESPRSMDTLCSVSRRTANPEERKIGETRTQLSISEIRRISEKVWYGTHQYLKYLSKIDEPSLKFKNQ
jgi:hypothetical protein